MPLIGIITLVLLLAQLALLVVAWLLYRPPRQQKQQPVFVEFKLSMTRIGSSIPAAFGQVRLGGNIIEWGDWRVIRHEETYSAGKK
ncbi:MAG: hypothetical protein QXT73_00780 [Candidatus Methanomethylicaceae archaeon]